MVWPAPGLAVSMMIRLSTIRTCQWNYMVALGYAIGYITVLYSELKWAHYNGVLPATVPPILTCNCLLLASVRGTSAAFPTSIYIYFDGGGITPKCYVYTWNYRRCRRKIIRQWWRTFRFRNADETIIWSSMPTCFLYSSQYLSIPTRFSNDMHARNISSWIQGERPVATYTFAKYRNYGQWLQRNGDCDTRTIMKSDFPAPTLDNHNLVFL